MLRGRNEPVRTISIMTTLFGLLSSACGSHEASHPSGEAYYGSWGSNSVPLTPSEPLSAAEALQRDAWYVGTYDDLGHLIQFQKYLYGKKDWREEYQYGSNGELLHRRVVKADGSVIEQRFHTEGGGTAP